MKKVGHSTQRQIFDKTILGNFITRVDSFVKFKYFM